jgi:hypothetical protein
MGRRLIIVKATRPDTFTGMVAESHARSTNVRFVAIALAQCTAFSV